MTEPKNSMGFTKDELLKWLEGAEHERLIYVPHRTNTEQREMYAKLVEIVEEHFRNPARNVNENLGGVINNEEV